MEAHRQGLMLNRITTHSTIIGPSLVATGQAGLLVPHVFTDWPVWWGYCRRLIQGRAPPTSDLPARAGRQSV